MEISKRWSVNTERIARESVASRTMRKFPKTKRGRYLLNSNVKKNKNVEKTLILLITIASSVFSGSFFYGVLVSGVVFFWAALYTV